MASAEEHIARLDRSLARNGEDVTLQRLALGPGGKQTPFSVKCRASVTGYKPEQLVGSIVQGDTLAVLSPTQITLAGWTNGVASGDTRVPNSANRLLVQGTPRTIKAATPFYVAGELVRIELQIRG
jgi:hypothetical protein